MRSFLRGCAWPLSAFPNVFLVLFRKNALFLPLWCPQTAASLASVIQYYHRCSAPPLCSTWNAAAPICNVEFSSGRSLSSLEPDGPLFVCVFLSETGPSPFTPPTIQRSALIDRSHNTAVQTPSSSPKSSSDLSRPAFSERIIFP